MGWDAVRAHWPYPHCQEQRSLMDQALMKSQGIWRRFEGGSNPRLQKILLHCLGSSYPSPYDEGECGGGEEEWWEVLGNAKSKEVPGEWL